MLPDILGSTLAPVLILHDNNIIVMIAFPNSLHWYTVLVMTTPSLAVDTATDINILGLL